MANDDKARNDMRVEEEVSKVVNDLSLIDVGIRIRLDLNNIRHFTAIIDGPVNTPYEGGMFIIDINLPDNYPFAPPHVRFITKIWHPNISRQSGAVRMSILNDEWSPAISLETFLVSLQCLLDKPELGDPLDEFALSHYRASQSSFINNAQYYTQKYAMQRDPPPQPATTRASGSRVSRIPKRLNDYLL